MSFWIIFFSWNASLNFHSFFSVSFIYRSIFFWTLIEIVTKPHTLSTILYNISKVNNILKPLFGYIFASLKFNVLSYCHFSFVNLLYKLGENLIFFVSFKALIWLIIISFSVTGLLLPLMVFCFLFLLPQVTIIPPYYIIQLLTEDFIDTSFSLHIIRPHAPNHHEHWISISAL